MIEDPNVAEVRRVREQLIEQHGGLDGWIEHLQEMDRQREQQSSRKTPRTKGRRTLPKLNGADKKSRSPSG